MSRLVVGLVAVLSVMAPCDNGAFAAILDPVVEGNELSARIVFPGILDVGVTVSFEEVDGLDLQSLGLDARLVSLLDPTFTSRLPSGTSPLSTLPLEVVIDPPVNGGLSFRGLPTVSLHVPLLLDPTITPLRLFGAPAGEPFRDVTAEDEWEGSYRAGGSEPEFMGEYPPSPLAARPSFFPRAGSWPTATRSSGCSGSVAWEWSTRRPTSGSG